MGSAPHWGVQIGGSPIFQPFGFARDCPEPVEGLRPRCSQRKLPLDVATAAVPALGFSGSALKPHSAPNPNPKMRTPPETRSFRAPLFLGSVNPSPLGEWM